MEHAARAGIVALLFGAGVGSSTQGTPPSDGTTETSPTDDYWWIVQAQRYLEAPVLLDSIPPAPEPLPEPTPLPAPTPNPPAGAAEVILDVESTWSGGYSGTFVLTNTGSDVLDPWIFCFETGPAIVETWNGIFDGEGCVSAPSWATSLPPGASAEFGFTAAGDVPNSVTGSTLNASPVTVSTPPTPGDGAVPVPMLRPPALWVLILCIALAGAQSETALRSQRRDLD